MQSYTNISEQNLSYNRLNSTDQEMHQDSKRRLLNYLKFNYAYIGDDAKLHQIQTQEDLQNIIKNNRGLVNYHGNFNQIYDARTMKDGQILIDVVLPDSNAGNYVVKDGKFVPQGQNWGFLRSYFSNNVKAKAPLQNITSLDKVVDDFQLKHGVELNLNLKTYEPKYIDKQLAKIDKNLSSLLNNSQFKKAIGYGEYDKAFGKVQENRVGETKWGKFRDGVKWLGRKVENGLNYYRKIIQFPGNAIQAGLEKLGLKNSAIGRFVMNIIGLTTMLVGLGPSEFAFKDANSKFAKFANGFATVVGTAALGVGVASIFTPLMPITLPLWAGVGLVAVGAASIPISISSVINSARNINTENVVTKPDVARNIAPSLGMPAGVNLENINSYESASMLGNSKNIFVPRGFPEVLHEIKKLTEGEVHFTISTQNGLSLKCKAVKDNNGSIFIDVGDANVKNLRVEQFLLSCENQKIASCQLSNTLNRSQSNSALNL